MEMSTLLPISDGRKPSHVAFLGKSEKSRMRMGVHAMPKGPDGQKRPADVIGNAVHIARIAAGEIEDTGLKQPAKRASGLAGAMARQENTTEVQRREIAERAAAARWE